MESNYASSEQFRATKVWNTIVSAVRQEMPIGRHRKGLKVFDNSFSGQEAVSWVVEYLKRNRELITAGQDVTREKVTLLLQKFLEQKIIQDVRSRGTTFKDSNAHLYTFNKENLAPVSTLEPCKEYSTALHARNVNQVNCKPSTSFRQYSENSIVPTASSSPKEPVPLSDLPSLSKHLLWRRLEQLFSSDPTNPFCSMANGEFLRSFSLFPSDYTASEVCHNICQVSSSRVVLPRTQGDDVPRYVMQAMKYLAKYPELVPMYASYPGFLNDALKIITDYFRGRLLLSRQLYELSMVAFAPMMESLQEPPEVPVSVHYETAFVTANPETKIMPRTARKTPLPRYVSQTPSSTMPRNHRDRLIQTCVRAASVRRIGNAVGCYVNSAFSTSSSSLSSSVSVVSDANVRTCKKVQSTEEQVIRQLQHLYILLSTRNRRALHLLLRFMFKVGQNSSLMLANHRSNHDVVVDTFSPCIVGALRTNLQQTLLFLTFLIDNCDDIFAVPESLRQEIDNAIKHRL